jgi:hypothetical protein
MSSLDTDKMFGELTDYDDLSIGGMDAIVAEVGRQVAEALEALAPAFGNADEALGIRRAALNVREWTGAE